MTEATDLLELLAEIDPPAKPPTPRELGCYNEPRTCDHIVHVCMPNMGLACGLDYLAREGDHVTFGAGEGNWPKVTCPDCRAFGQHHLRRETYRQQGEASWARWLERYPACTEWPCACDDEGETARD